MSVELQWVTIRACATSADPISPVLRYLCLFAYVQLPICRTFISSMSWLSRADVAARVREPLTDRVSSYGGIVLSVHRTVCACDCARYTVVISECVFLHV